MHFPLEPQGRLWLLISAQGKRFQTSDVQNHREYMRVALSHQVGGDLLQQPKETPTLTTLVSVMLPLDTILTETFGQGNCSAR